MVISKTDSSRKIYLFVFLASLFIANAMIAEVIGVKLISVEKVFHLPPMHLPFLGGTKLDLNLSVGVLIWPVVFILSDVINEYYGKRGVKRISFMGAGMIAYAFIIIYIATEAPPADLWLNNNAIDDAGNSFDVNFAYARLFKQGLNIIIGSLTAFLIGQLVDAYTFYYLRRLTHHRLLWLRATGSTVVSQLFDSFLILFIAFYLLGNWSMVDVLAVFVVQYVYKIFLAIVLTPAIYWAHYFIDRYLGKEGAIEMIERAEKL
jgi:uncharacterized integral membrane protein (TIGR00697 family)